MFASLSSTLAARASSCIRLEAMSVNSLYVSSCVYRMIQAFHIRPLRSFVQSVPEKKRYTAFIFASTFANLDRFARFVHSDNHKAYKAKFIRHVGSKKSATKFFHKLRKILILETVSPALSPEECR